MPKSKHRRKPGDKAVLRPGRDYSKFGYGLWPTGTDRKEQALAEERALLREFLAGLPPGAGEEIVEAYRLNRLYDRRARKIADKYELTDATRWALVDLPDDYPILSPEPVDKTGDVREHGG